MNASGPAFAVWFTGLSSSGKTTLATALQKELQSLGLQVKLLDGDVLRKSVSPDLGYSREDREIHVDRVALLAASLADSGVLPVVALISPYSAMRERARHKFASFVEVYVRCPLSVCEARDVKGLYKRARKGEIDHFTGKPTGGSRSVLAESARIARCNVVDLATVKGADVDAWVMPGGYGAAKNLSDFATKGAAATVNKDVGRIVREAFAAQIPIGACCIAPAILAAAAKQVASHLRLTIGNDSEVAKQIASMGHIHVECKVDDVVLDTDRKVVTAPAYMYGDAPVAAVAAGIDKMVAQVLAWA